MLRRAGIAGGLLVWVLGCAGLGDTSTPVQLVSLEAGDVACYVTVNDGTEHFYDGDFDLCEGGAIDASALVGKPVLLELEKANVRAGSCEGDPDCSDTEEVDLVVAITAADG